MVIGNAIVLFGLVLGMLMAQFMLLSLNSSDTDGELSDEDNVITGFAIDDPPDGVQGQVAKHDIKRAIDIGSVLPDKIAVDTILVKGDHTRDTISASEFEDLQMNPVSGLSRSASEPQSMVTEFVKVCDVYSYGVIKRDNLICAVDDGYAILAHLYELLFESWKEN
jgi:hypothetical protein